MIEYKVFATFHLRFLYVVISEVGVAATIHLKQYIAAQAKGDSNNKNKSRCRSSRCSSRLCFLTTKTFRKRFCSKPRPRLRTHNCYEHMFKKRSYRKLHYVETTVTNTSETTMESYRLDCVQIVTTTFSSGTKRFLYIFISRSMYIYIYI